MAIREFASLSGSGFVSRQWRSSPDQVGGYEICCCPSSGMSPLLVLYLRGYDIQVPTLSRPIHAHGIDVTSCSYSKVPLHTTRDYWFQDARRLSWCGDFFCHKNDATYEIRNGISAFPRIPRHPSVR